MRLLIAVGETASEPTDVPAGVPLLVEAASEILVMSPSLVSRLEWLTGDVDKARRIADERIATVLDQLESRGLSASGRRGDELPRTAFADAIRQFAPDHVLIAFRGGEGRAWQRDDLVEHLLERFHLPITVFEIHEKERGAAAD